MSDNLRQRRKLSKNYTGHNLSEYLRLEKERYEDHKEASEPQGVTLAIHLSGHSKSVTFAVCEVSDHKMPKHHEERLTHRGSKHIHSRVAHVCYELPILRQPRYTIRSLISFTYNDLNKVCSVIVEQIKAVKEIHRNYTISMNSNGIAGNILKILRSEYKVSIRKKNQYDLGSWQERESRVVKVNEILGFNRLQFADSIQHKEAMLEEVSRYTRRENRNGDIYFDYSEGKHDDLVMALGMSLETRNKITRRSSPVEPIITKYAWE